MPTLVDGTLPTLGRRPYHRAPATRVEYVDPETVKERSGGLRRQCRQRRFYARHDAIIPADLGALCDRIDGALRAEIRAHMASGRSLVLAGGWTAVVSPTDDPAPVAVD